jgi:hypothetical protein
MYVMLDDQSNRSLARSAFFDLFKVNSRPEEYIMSSCSGKMTTSGHEEFTIVVLCCFEGKFVDFIGVSPP